MMPWSSTQWLVSRDHWCPAQGAHSPQQPGGVQTPPVLSLRTSQLLPTLGRMLHCVLCPPLCGVEKANMAAGPKADRTGGGGWEKDNPCTLVPQPRHLCCSLLGPPHGPHRESKAQSSMWTT